MTVECEKFRTLKIQDGAQPPSWKSLYGRILAKYYQEFDETLYTLK